MATEYGAIAAQTPEGGRQESGSRLAAIRNASLAALAVLAVEFVLGVAIASVARSAASRRRSLAISSVTAALALVAATLLGFMFLGRGQDGASLGMALATGVAMICYGFNVWVISGARTPGRP